MIIDRIQWMLAAALLALALVLGGGQGTLGDSLCQFLALALIALTLWRHQVDSEAHLPKLAWLALLPLALPILQLLAAPDVIWQLAPERAELSRELQAASAAVPSRMSLTPLATERALFWLLPAIALFLAVLQFGTAQRQRILGVFTLIAVVAAVLGLIQLAGGVESPLRFYEITNQSNAVGFFANRNHHAVILAMALPLVLIATSRLLAEQGGVGVSQGLWLVTGAGLVALLILGIAITSSRAGVILGMLALLISMPAVLGLRRRRGTRRFLVLAVGLGLTLAMQFTLLGLMQRFDADPLDNDRFRYAQLVMQAASEQSPLGTGLGGFRRTLEAADSAEPAAAYINHAHNDYAELWLEGGWLAALLAIPLLAAFAVGSARVWFGNGADRSEQAFMRAAWIAVLLVLMHSLVDYPLRTTAHLALLGLLAALLVPARCLAPPPGVPPNSFVPATPNS